jgi:hypothetical protein
MSVPRAKPAPKQDPILDRRSRGLRQAASTVFVLTAVLPLLILTWTLGRLHALHTLDAQIGLLLALAVALLGLAVFRSLMARLSAVILALRTLAARREGGMPAAGKGGDRTETGRAHRIPVVGEIGELRDIEEALAAKWQTVASAYLGRPVLVYVSNSWSPIVGTLRDVTADGVLVEQEGEEVAVGYRRFVGIKLAEV